MNHTDMVEGHTVQPQQAEPTTQVGTISSIMSEFAAVFAFTRSQWAKYSSEAHPELRTAGMMTLQLIIRKGPISATEIGRILDMDKAAVSRHVSKLRDCEFVTASPDTVDRRVILLSATPHAHTTVAELRQATAEGYQERFANWGEEDLHMLRELLHRFNEDASP